MRGYQERDEKPRPFVCLFWLCTCGRDQPGMGRSSVGSMPDGNGARSCKVSAASTRSAMSARIEFSGCAGSLTSRLTNQAEDQRRKQRIQAAVAECEKAGQSISTLVTRARRATQRSVKFVRWVRQAIRDQAAEAVGCVPSYGLNYTGKLGRKGTTKFHFRRGAARVRQLRPRIRSRLQGPPPFSHGGVDGFFNASRVA